MADDSLALPRRVYFDAQQLNYFAAPDTGPHPEGALKAVQRAVKAGHIEVVGSLDLLQELIEALPLAPKKSRRMLDLNFKLVGDRILLPLSERHPKEAKTGGVLSVEDRYLSPDVRRDVRRLAQSLSGAAELADELFREKRKFLEAEKEVQERMRNRLVELGATKQAPLMRDWIDSVDIDEWVRDIGDAGRRTGRISKNASIEPDDVPSVVAFVACRLGRLARTLGEGRKIQDSDLADAHHVACGPYIDVLVTDDKELRSSLDLVRTRLTFQWMSSSEFFSATG